MKRQERMTKKFFYELMESRIKEIESDSEKWKEKEKKEGYTHEVSYARSGLHARILELNMLIFETRNIEWIKYIELTEKLNKIRESI